MRNFWIGLKFLAGLTQKFFYDTGLNSIHCSSCCIPSWTNYKSLFQGVIFLHYTWVAPLAMIGYVYLLWCELGWASLAGFAGIIILLPIQGYFSREMGKCRSVVIRIGHKDFLIVRISASRKTARLDTSRTTSVNYY